MDSLVMETISSVASNKNASTADRIVIIRLLISAMCADVMKDPNEAKSDNEGMKT